MNPSFLQKFLKQFIQEKKKNEKNLYPRFLILFYSVMTANPQ